MGWDLDFITDPIKDVVGGAVDFVGGNSGLFGSAGTSAANYAISKAQTKKQQEFAREQMQNKHQWEVQDLLKAGLNPILSATGSTGMTSGGGHNPVHAENPLSSAASLSQAQEQKKLLANQNEESKRRQVILDSEGSIASSKATKERVEAERADALWARDKETFGKGFGSTMESLPGWIKGPTRWGVQSAQNVGYIVNKLWADIQQKLKNQRYENEQNKKNDVSGAVKKYKENLKMLDLKRGKINNEPLVKPKYRSKEFN